MSDQAFMRSILDALLPPGPKWVPADGLDFDLFLDGLADIYPPIKNFLGDLACLRDPETTPYLSDLEKEFGILTKENLTEAIRRELLAARIYERGGTGSATNLQAALVRAGFDVQIHENSPAVDPAIFLDENFQITLGDPISAFIGDPDAYLGRIGGELLVNGPLFDQYPLYLTALGAPDMQLGDPAAFLGDFDELVRNPQVYPIPTNPDSWPFIFFVGGDATRNPGTGELTAIEQAEIPATQIGEFKNIILRYKPLHTWAGLIITVT